MKATRISRFGISILTVLCTTASFVVAQEVRMQEQTAPPPLKIVARQDRMQIEAEKDSKERVQLTLILAEGQLANAELQTSHLNYDEAASAAGRYSALIEELFTFIGTLKQDSNKTRDLYKRVELALRAHGPRLAFMRRSTPAAYALWIKDTEDFARRGRTEALNSFYGHTVFRDRSTTLSPKSESNVLRNSAPSPEKKP